MQILFWLRHSWAVHSKRSIIMNSKTVAFALFLSLTLISCEPAAKDVDATLTPQKSRESEELAIYELLLQDECKNSYQGTPVFIIDKTISATGFDLENIPWVGPSLDKETLGEYEEINQSQLSFIPDLSDYQFCELITSEELASLVQQDPNWFNNHMVIQFSRVGFNDSIDQALAYREYNCGGECAGGDLYFLIRQTNNQWFIINTVGGWRS